MSEEDQIRERILQASLSLFERHGFRRVTMDDIANALAMSKKTIYTYFNDKKELVDAASAFKMAEQKEAYENIKKEAENAVDELFRISNHLRRTVYEFHQNILHDLKKYYPSVWEKFLAFKNDYVINSIRHNLEWGIQDGYFKKTINPEILSVLRMEEVDLCFNPEKYPAARFVTREVHEQLHQHFIEGILTQKGRELYTKYLEKIKTDNETVEG